jgi:hypothetical protein
MSPYASDQAGGLETPHDSRSPTNGLPVYLPCLAGNDLRGFAMYSAKEVAAWVLNAPEGNIAATITTEATYLIPGDLGRFVILLDAEGYIFAMWKRTLTNEGQPFYTWQLQRRRRAANEAVLSAMVKHSATRQPVSA